MRKMKKINGFLVVRFNDREKQGCPQLGNFGVIDAELYTGSIDIDLGVFEYDDAGTIEVAVEQARGLDAEQDYSDEPPVYTVIVESAEEATEEEVEPRGLIQAREKRLAVEIRSRNFPYIDPRTAAHELIGYKAALYDLGLLEKGEEAVDLDHFAPGMAEQPLPRSSEELLAHVCDELCQFRAGRTQEELDAVCKKCKLERLASEADDRELRLKETAKKRLEGYAQELAETQLNTKAERLEHEARLPRSPHHDEDLLGAGGHDLRGRDLGGAQSEAGASGAEDLHEPPLGHEERPQHAEGLLPGPRPRRGVPR